MKKIKPCPFCNSKIPADDTLVKTGIGGFRHVQCNKCGAMGPLYDAGNKPIFTEEKAIKGWNERKNKK